MAGPLAGYRIIEISGIGPGPFGAMMLANLMFMAMGLYAAKVFARISLVPLQMLWPIVFALAAIGAYALSSSLLDVWIAPDQSGNQVKLRHRDGRIGRHSQTGVPRIDGHLEFLVGKTTHLYDIDLFEDALSGSRSGISIDSRTHQHQTCATVDVRIDRVAETQLLPHLGEEA